MFRFLFIATFLVWGSFGDSSHDLRIVGGTDAALGEFPFMVSIRVMDYHICGGSILSSKFVLSAGHCFPKWLNQTYLMSVHYGIIHLDDYSVGNAVDTIIMHEQYENTGQKKNDIALVKVQGTIMFGPNIEPVELPSRNEEPKSKTGTLIGWGNLQVRRFNDLQKVTVNIIPDSVCQKTEVLYNPQYMLCAGDLAGGKAQCTGDSGGPLMITGKQFGVISRSKKPCGSAGHGGISTKVSQYISWISDHMKL